MAYAHAGPGNGYQVSGEPLDVEPTPTQVEEAYTTPVAIVPAAVPVDAAQVKQLAGLDPLGEFADHDLALLLGAARQAPPA